MEVRERFSVTAPPGDVAALLLDVDAVSSCVPGVEGVAQTLDGSYEATLVVRVGPIKTRFAGTLHLDGDDAPDVLRANGKGRDRETNSQVAVEMEASLTPTEQGTDVSVVAQLTIRGRLGQFGTGVVQGTASELTKSFAQCLQSKVEARAVADPTAAAPPATPADASVPPTAASARNAQQVALLPVLVRGLWRSLRTAVSKLFRRIAGLFRRRAR